MENVSVHGARRSTTVPAAASGTGKPVVVTDESWYSEELHLNLLIKHDDPRSGQQTVMVTHVDRNEPKSDDVSNSCRLSSSGRNARAIAHSVDW
jgi:hypothetical protein